jgi:hypothetical protein
MVIDTKQAETAMAMPDVAAKIADDARENLVVSVGPLWGELAAGRMQ